MNLDTRYLNMTLRSPLVVSASPLSHRLDDVRRAEDAGASAIVLYSLFEEHIRVEQQMLDYYRENPSATPANAQAIFPVQENFASRSEAYLNHIARVKQAVKVPVIASLNCRSLGRWMDVAQQLEQTGADALELNIYHFPTRIEQTAAQVEDTYVTILKIIKSQVNIPVAVKLSPYFTNVATVARRLDEAEADALVLFNRYYQPDLDPKSLRFMADIPLGHRSDSRLPLHWIATLFGYVKADLAATGGIYTAEDVVKMLLVGAKVTMLASVLLTEGIDHLRTIEQDLRTWLDQNDYNSVASLQGILRQFHNRNTSELERNEYIRAITPGELGQ